MNLQCFNVLHNSPGASDEVKYYIGMIFAQQPKKDRIFQGAGETAVTYEDKTFTESRLMLADSNFFNFFSIRLLKGDPENILKSPQELILTETTARKYFGDEEPVGKSLTFPFGELQVVGVCENVLVNSHFHFDFIGGLNGAGFIRQPSYMTFSVYTY